jgi:hypothetical protein
MEGCQHTMSCVTVSAACSIHLVTLNHHSIITVPAAPAPFPYPIPPSQASSPLPCLPSMQSNSRQQLQQRHQQPLTAGPSPTGRLTHCSLVTPCWGLTLHAVACCGSSGPACWPTRQPIPWCCWTWRPSSSLCCRIIARALERLQSARTGACLLLGQSRQNQQVCLLRLSW